MCHLQHGLKTTRSEQVWLDIFFLYAILIITAYDIVDCNTKGADRNENVSVSFSLCSVSAGSL